MDYLVIAGAGVEVAAAQDDLENRIRKFLALGWSLQGGASICVENLEYVLVQAITHPADQGPLPE